MSTATATFAAAAEGVIPTDAEAVFIICAKAQLARVHADTFPWPRETGKRTSILMASDGLRDSLDEFKGLRQGTLHPESVFFDLAPGHPDGALAEAMERVTEDIRDWTAALASLADEATVLANGGQQS